jgi:CrcB protein
VTFLLVFLGGAVGAPTRYLTDRYLTPVLARDRFPLGTLVVNVVGCFVLGVVAGGVAHAGWSASTQALVGTGFCGGLTTFSTFSVETIDLLAGRRTGASALYVALSLVLGIGAAFLGYGIA